MTARSRGTARAAASLMRTSQRRVCTECIISNLAPRRAYSAAAVATATSTTSSPEPSSTPSSASPTSTAPYKTYTGIVLSRPPLLTPPQTAFEKAFFFYQKRLNERLVMPFTRYFYFKKGTPADIDWKVKAKERNWAPAKELGGYNPYDRKEGWNDELLVKDAQMAETDVLRQKLLDDAKVRVVEGRESGVDGEVEVEEGSLEVVPESRRTESDRRGDKRKLDRELTRTLYLVVKKAGSGWGFPAGEVLGREALHQTAERVLVQSAGLNMNTWLVGRVPIGHHTLQPYRETKDKSADSGALIPGSGRKTFFLKARIMAGQADLKDNLFGLEDYKWLTREEIEKVVGNKYWSCVKKFLHER